MEVGFLRWGKSGWRSFAVILSVLLLHIPLLGYPLLTYDSHRYIPTALYFTTNDYSLTLVSHLLHPLVKLTGAYGFVLASMLLLSYTLNSVLIHFKKGVLVGVIAVCACALGLIASQVMMDAYTVIGLLALYLILEGRRDVILHLILSISYIAHYSNIILYPLVAALWWIIFNRGNARPLLTLGVLFLAPIAAATASHYIVEQEFRFSSRGSYSYIADFIMRASSEATLAFISEHPESLLAKNKQVYVEVLEGRRERMGILWEEDNLISHMGGPIGYNREAREFVSYAIVNHPITLLGVWSHGTLLFLAKPEFNKAFDFSNQREVLMNYIDLYLPWQRDDAMNSLQYKQELGSTNLRVFTYSYYMSYLCAATLTLIFMLYPIYRRMRYYRFTVFVSSVILLNALIMSPFELISRYKIRVLLLPCLLVCIVFSDWLDSKVNVVDSGDA